MTTHAPDLRLVEPEEPEAPDPWIGQTLDGQAETRQDVIVDDIVEKYRIGIERFPLEHHAVCECGVVTDNRYSSKVAITVIEGRPAAL